MPPGAPVWPGLDHERPVGIRWPRQIAEIGRVALIFAPMLAPRKRLIFEPYRVRLDRSAWKLARIRWDAVSYRYPRRGIDFEPIP